MFFPDACAVEMSTVGESQDPPWKDVLYTKGLSAAATILEEYGLSCESDMSLVDEDDLVVLCSKLKPFQSKLLRKWVQGLGSEQRAAASGTTLSWQCSRSTTNAISELLLLCVCVCDEIYIYMYPLLPRRARCVCVLWI